MKSWYDIEKEAQKSIYDIGQKFSVISTTSKKKKTYKTFIGALKHYTCGDKIEYSGRS